MNREQELEELKKFKTVKNPDTLNGRWKLVYKLVNSQGINAFSGKSISSYTDALTQKGRHLFDADGQFKSNLFLNKLVTIFNPAENQNDRLIVDWLIGHPEVGIDKDHVSINDKYFLKKAGNPRLTLVNLDHVVTTNIDEQDYIDRLLGKLSLEGGKDAIGLEKLRVILSALNMPYMDAKYMRDKQKEKKMLRSSLKNYVRSSLLSAKKVEKILNDLGQATYAYEIKEMVRVEVLNIHGGMYKLNGMPIGSALESVIKYFSDNIEVYSELSGLLYDKLKSERE